MAISIRKDDKVKRIVYGILGPPPSGATDSFGNKKKFVKKKEKQHEGERTNREEVGNF